MERCQGTVLHAVTERARGWLRTPRACLERALFPALAQDGNGLADEGSKDKGSLQEKERVKRLSDSNISKNIVFLCNRESSVTGVYYKWSDILKSMTKKTTHVYIDVYLAHYVFLS